MKKQALNLFVGATLCSLFFAPCSSSAQVPSYVPTNGLVGWWPFNGNANDESGNGNNGTVNGATLTTDRFGINDNAYSFDGVDDKIAFLGSSIDFNLNYTISFWLNPESPSSNQCFLNTEPHTVLALEYNYTSNPTANSITSWIGYGGPTWVFANIHSDNVMDLNEWNFITLCKQGNTLSLMNNGQITIQIQNIPDNLSSANAYLILGFANAFGGIEYFNGKIDDIGIWNRALTACEIADLYNSQLGNLNTSSSQTESAIDSYTWPVNGQTYTQSGSYTAVIPNAAGCDSTITLNLTLGFTEIEDLQFNASKKLLKITDLNGKETPFRKNTVLIFIYDDGTIERVFEAE